MDEDPEREYYSDPDEHDERPGAPSGLPGADSGRHSLERFCLELAREIERQALERHLKPCSPIELDKPSQRQTMVACLSDSEYEAPRVRLRRRPPRASADQVAKSREENFRTKQAREACAKLVQDLMANSSIGPPSRGAQMFERRQRESTNWIVAEQPNGEQRAPASCEPEEAVARVWPPIGKTASIRRVTLEHLIECQPVGGASLGEWNQKVLPISKWR